MSLNTTPRTWVANEVVDETLLNTEVRDALTGIQAAWTAYTPTTTNLTLGNGTKTGRYTRFGKTVFFSITITFGSTTALTGGPTFTLPVTAHDSRWVSFSGTGYDTSAAVFYPMAALANSTTVVEARTLPGTAGNNFLVLSSTTPFTWATGDILSLTGQYEAA